MSCPFCGSTDVADLAKSDRRICLDCEQTWLPKARRRRG